MAPNQAVVMHRRGDSTQLWMEALSSLPPADQQTLTVHTSSKAEVLKNLLAITNEKKALCLQNRWKYRGREGEVVIRDQLEKITMWIEKFKHAGSVAVQYDPVHAALPWAGVLILLQITLNDSQTFGAMVEGVEIVSSRITRYTIFESLYITQNQGSALHQELREAFVKLYVSVLRYLVRAKDYFSKSTIRRALKASVNPAHTAVLFHLDVIDKNAKHVDECLEVLRSQSLEEIESNSRRLLDLHVDMEEPITTSATRIDAIHRHLKIDERQRIHRWLSTISSTVHHRSIGQNFLLGSGDWLLQHPDFITFRDSSASALLWLHGVPGSGKTYLTHHVINHLRLAAGHTDSVAFFYCARNPAEPRRASVDEIMRNILKQLIPLDSTITIHPEVTTMFREKLSDLDSGSDPGPLSTHECVTVMLKILQREKFTIVLDALDECDPNRRHELFAAIERIILGAPHAVKIFVSSRDSMDISDHFSTKPNIRVTPEHNSMDVERFIHHSLGDALKTKGFFTRAGGMFRWVSLQIDNLCDFQRIKIESDVRDEMDRLPRGLIDSYDVQWSRVRSMATSSQLVAERVFKWLLCGQRLLNVEELQSIIGHPTICDSLTIDNIIDICCFFIAIDDCNVVRFVHVSVRDYLEQQPEFSIPLCHASALRDCMAAYSTWQGCNSDCTARIGSYAMHYWPAHLGGIEAVDNHDLRDVIERFIFRDSQQPDRMYSFEDWMSDAQNISDYREFLNEDDRYRQRVGAAASSKPVPLFLACCFDVPWLLDTLLRRGYTEWSLKNLQNDCPAVLAVRWSSGTVLCLLLEHGTTSSQDTADALAVAIEEQNEMCKEAIMQHGFNGYLPTSDSDVSILQLALAHDDDSVVHYILSKEHAVYPDSFASALKFAFDEQSHLFDLMWCLCIEFTPTLYLAILLHILDEDDHPLAEHMLNFTYTNDTLSGIRDLHEMDFLTCLAVRESGAVFEIIFDDENFFHSTVNTEDSRVTKESLRERFTDLEWNPDSPLMAVVILHKGKDEVLTRLLIPFCDVNKIYDGITNLSLAVIFGKASIASLLLAGGANANHPFSTDQASTENSSDQASTVSSSDQASTLSSSLVLFAPISEPERFLLDNLHVPDIISPLECAVYSGDVDVASVLISYGAELQGRQHGLYTLLWACGLGHTKMIQLLYENGIDIDTRNKYGYSCLHYVVIKHEHESLQWLCENSSANLNARCTNGVTPLMLAVRSVCNYCVEQLLSSGAEVSATDNEGLEVSQYINEACKIRGFLFDFDSWEEEQCFSVAQKLLQRGVKWSGRYSSGPSLLNVAIRRGNSELAKSFLEAGMSPDGVDASGCSLMVTAIEMNHLAVAQLLRNYGASLQLHTDGFGSEIGSLVHLAVKTQDIDTLRFLIQENAPINLQDSDGNTALHSAVLLDCPVELIDLLLSGGASDQIRNHAGLTPWDVPIGYRHRGRPVDVDLTSRRSSQAQDDDLREILPLLQDNVKNCDNPFAESYDNQYPECYDNQRPNNCDDPFADSLDNPFADSMEESDNTKPPIDFPATSGSLWRRQKSEIDLFTSYGESAWSTIGPSTTLPLRPVDAKFRQ